MKTIIVNFKNSHSVELIDSDDDKSTEEYAEELSKTLDSNNITILHTTSGSLVIRPNEVSSIAVFEGEVEFKYNDETSDTVYETVEPEDQPKETHEDIITD